jgi:hypothetical protein
MIRKLPTNWFGEAVETLCCDHCGEGMALNTDDIAALDLFHSDHENCTKIKNNNLSFLQTTEPFEG